MFSEMVNPASVVNSHDKSVNSTCLRLEGKKTIGCLDKQQIFSVVGPDEIHSEVLKKKNKPHLAEVMSDLIVGGSSRLKKNNGAYLFSMG